MKKKKAGSLVPEEVLVNKIFLVRGKKVMVDRDLAELYGVETKRLKEAVRRNKERFPADFMFEMKAAEFKNWRTQFATSNPEARKGMRYRPFCFTEQGVTMLSCILNSPRAIDVNIRVIRVFTRLREALMSNKDILLKLEKLEKQVMKNSDDVTRIFTVLRQLLQEPQSPRTRIGYRTSRNDT